MNKRAQCVAFKATVGCCFGNTVVNRLMDAGDIVVFTPSPNGVQRVVDVSYTYMGVTITLYSIGHHHN